MAVLQPNAGHGSKLKTALHRSQQAPAVLNHHGSAGLLSRYLILENDDSGNFDSLEKLFFSCLQSADDKSALLCLERLTHRFGASNERVMALHSLYDEAIAEDKPSLERCLKKYDDILSQNPVNLPILKRRVVLLQSLSRPAEAISSLIQLLDATPTDAEAWCELAELYHSQGMCPQAIFSFEEALLVVPNAWNVHARLGEILYIYASSLGDEALCQQLHSSIRHFCRSVELCDGYLRGFYGLALATTRLLVDKLPETISKDPGKESLRRLHDLTTQRLKDILATQCSLEPRLRRYEEHELAAVKNFLNDCPE